MAPEPASSTPADQRQDVTPRDERKLVTVVVVRLTIPGQDDPEELRAGVRALTADVAERIRYYGGDLQSTDVGYLLAAFGAARSYEDDAERAVRAALDIRASISSNGGQAHVGVATGEVVVSRTQPQPPGGGGAAPITGDVLYAAAALEAAAAAGVVLVGAGTYQTTRHVIEYDQAPALPLARATGMQVWKAVNPRGRTGARDEPTASPLIERDQELKLLVGLLERFMDDKEPHKEPYQVTVISDAGLGKSRLVAELSRIADELPKLISWRVGHARPYGQASMGPLVDVVKAQAGVLEGDPADVALGKLRDSVVTGATDSAEADQIMTDLAVLLGSGQSEGDPDRQRAHFAGWAAFLSAMAALRPLVMVLEDLHWADPVLLEFLADLPERVGSVPLLVVCTARPELLERVQEARTPVRNAATVTLAPLSREATGQLLDALTGTAGLPAETREAVATAAAGNPLYVEEYARMLEQPADPAPGARPALPIPPTVQQLIAARLDILPLGDKHLLHDAAVLGEAGWVGALAEVSGTDRAEVEAAVGRLQRRGFVRRLRRSSVAGDTEYTFQHSLLRDVAYQQILRGERAERHRRAAAWIESLNPVSGERIELLAYHYSRAVELLRATGGLPEELVTRTAEVLRAAGDRYMTLGALASADRSYTAALELWQGDCPTRPELLYRLGLARLWTRHEGRDELLEARDAFADADNRVRAAQASVALAHLCRNTGDPDGVRVHLHDALTFNPDDPEANVVATSQQALELAISGNLVEAIELGRDTASKAAALGLAGEEARALNAAGMARLESGDAAGEDDCARSVARFEQGNVPDVDFGRWAHAQALVLYGNLPRAAELATRGRHLAQTREEAGVPDVLEWFNAILAVVDYGAGRWHEVLGYVEQALAKSDRKRAYPEPWYRPVRGRVCLGRGDVGGALEDAREGRVVAELTGEHRMVQPCRALEARALAAGRKPEQAVALLDALLADQRADPSRATVTADQAGLLVALDYPEDALPGELWPTRWHQAAYALVGRDFATAAEVYAEAGARADEATARYLHARQLAARDEHATARAELDRAVAFWRQAGAGAHLREAEALAAAIS